MEVVHSNESVSSVTAVSKQEQKTLFFLTLFPDLPADTFIIEGTPYHHNVTTLLSTTIHYYYSIICIYSHSYHCYYYYYCDYWRITDFSCAWQKDILIQGRLYITPTHFCFYANILTWVHQLQILVSEITKIEKKSIVGFIPNAIKISTPSTSVTIMFMSVMKSISLRRSCRGIMHLIC